MKYLIPLCLAGLLSSSVHAQNGFYLAPSAGAGISNTQHHYTTYDNTGAATSTHTSSIFSYNFRAGIGYRYKNWRFESGLQYISNGYLMNDLVFGSGFDPTGTVQTYGSYKTRLNHIGIPLQVSYNILLSRKLSLVPGAGFITTYTLGGTYETNEGGGMVRTGDWTKKALDDYGRISVWGQASLQLEYKINQKISLFGGPSLQYQFFKSSGGGIGKNPYNLHFNLGVKISL